MIYKGVTFSNRKLGLPLLSSHFGTLEPEKELITTWKHLATGRGLQSVVSPLYFRAATGKGIIYNYNGDHIQQ